MKVAIDVQRIMPGGPSDELIQKWVEVVLAAEQKDDVELTVRIVDENESAALNQEYRNKTGSTNVLSFPFECPGEVELNLLGDLVICAPVVEREARQQGKNSQAHWAHMLVHGVLHLLGYDHVEESDAVDMEAREVQILQKLGFADPYLITEDRKKDSI
jgi:probable rRNA maturation factor